MRFGGNTSCVEVRIDDRVVVLDAGTGIRPLGKELVKRGDTDITLMFSHTHWDHINGFPFFVPAFLPDRTVRIMAGHIDDPGGIRGVLVDQMAHPMFPVPLEVMRSTMTFTDFEAGESFTLFDFLPVRTAKLNHPNNATAYRFDHDGKSFCYVTDTEHVVGQTDGTIVDLIEGADLVVYDATYTQEEFGDKVGWGHSTWSEGVRLCRAANARNLALFHFDPEHEDDFMETLEAEAKAEWPGVFAAREGLVIDLTKI
jgi:phosphoribosyl 1,2-cyclic phosphodiesterase